MIKVIRSSESEHDLLRIWVYIARFNEQAATALIRRINDKVSRLQTFPEMGSPRGNEIRPGARLLAEGRYNILYRYDEPDALVTIVAIIEAERDLDEGED